MEWHLRPQNTIREICSNTKSNLHVRDTHTLVDYIRHCVPRPKATLVITVLILFSEVAHEVSALGKQQVAHTCTKCDRQEQPAVVSHGYEHEQVSKAHLGHVQGRLDQVHGHADRIEPETVQQKMRINKSHNQTCM